MATYLGHVLAHRSHEEQVCDLVINGVHYDLTAYTTLPVNGFEKTAIIHAVMTPRRAYRGLFLGTRQHMAQWDRIIMQYVRDTHGVKP